MQFSATSSQTRWFISVRKTSLEEWRPHVEKHVKWDETDYRTDSLGGRIEEFYLLELICIPFPILKLQFREIG